MAGHPRPDAGTDHPGDHASSDRSGTDGRNPCPRQGTGGGAGPARSPPAAKRSLPLPLGTATRSADSSDYPEPLIPRPRGGYAQRYSSTCCCSHTRTPVKLTKRGAGPGWVDCPGHSFSFSGRIFVRITAQIRRKFDFRGPF